MVNDTGNTIIITAFLSFKNNESLYITPIYLHANSIVNFNKVIRFLNSRLIYNDLKLLRSKDLQYCFGEYLIISPSQTKIIKIKQGDDLDNVYNELISINKKEGDNMTYERRLNLELENGKLNLSRTGENENLIRVKNNILQLTDNELLELNNMICDLLNIKK